MRAQTPVAVRSDVYPAILVVAPPGCPDPATITRYPRPDDPHGRRLLEKVRVVVGEDHVYVFKDSPQGPELVFAEAFDPDPAAAAYTPPVPLHRRRVREASSPSEALLTTKSGKTLAFARQGGCGCGSRLKTFDPFQVIMQHAADAAQTKENAS